MLKVHERFLDKVMPIPFSGCWIRDGYIMKEGYTQCGSGVKGIKELTHRMAYLLWIGPIAPNMEVHHKCKVKSCCNPAHLELRTIASHRAEHGNQYRNVTHCINGHEFTDDNAYINPTSGSRGCRTCMREKGRVRARDWYRARARRRRPQTS